MVRIKVRLVAQTYNQQEEIDFTQTFAPVAKSKVIKIFLVFDAHKNIKLCQLYVKSIFLNDFIEEDSFL